MLISMHIPKTAGTSFNNLLAKVYGDQLIFDYPNPTCDPHLKRLSGKRVLSQEQKNKLVTYCSQNKVACIHGHFPLEKFFNLFSNSTYITFLRDPVERMLSNYFYQKNFPWREQIEKGIITPDVYPIGYKIWNGEMTLVEYFSLPNNINPYSKKFSLEKYFNHFKFIGITERFDASLKVFSRKFDLDYDLEAVRINETKGITFKTCDLDKSLLDKIKKNNQKDYRLYNMALEKLETASARLGVL